MNYGTFVYRGMNPRTSDRYFTTLKEADYNQTPGFGHWKDRLKEPLSFNSKFECGNLNYAIKVLCGCIKGLDKRERVRFVYPSGHQHTGTPSMVLL